MAAAAAPQPTANDADTSPQLVDDRPQAAKRVRSMMETPISDRPERRYMPQDYEGDFEPRMPSTGIAIAELAGSDRYIPAHLLSLRKLFLKSCTDAPQRATRTREFMRKMALPTFTARDLPLDATAEANAQWKTAKTAELQTGLAALTFPALFDKFEDSVLSFQHTVGESMMRPVYLSWLHRTGYAARAIFDEACFSSVINLREQEEMANKKATQEQAEKTRRDQAFARMNGVDFIRDEVKRQLDARSAEKRTTRRPVDVDAASADAPQRPRSYAEVARPSSKAKAKDKGQRERTQAQTQQQQQPRRQQSKARQKPASDAAAGNEPRPRQPRRPPGKAVRGPAPRSGNADKKSMPEPQQKKKKNAPGQQRRAQAPHRV